LKSQQELDCSGSKEDEAEDIERLEERWQNFNRSTLFSLLGNAGKDQEGSN
jgi:hypothetical protein